MLFRTGMRWTLALASVCAFAACGGDTQSEDAVSAGADSLAAGSDLARDDMSDANIMSMIGMTNAAEIAAGELASTKARNADVKAFARQMVTEHQAMQKEADQLATSASVTPQAPPGADSTQRAANASLDSLKGATGADFDRAYMAAQVRDHQAALANLQRFHGAAQNAELRTLIGNAIPKVQAHLDKATQVHSQLGGGATASAAGTARASGGH
jgi:putative membrane protein